MLTEVDCVTKHEDVLNAELVRLRRPMNTTRVIGGGCVVLVLVSYLADDVYSSAVAVSCGAVLIATVIVGVRLQMRAYRLRRAIAQMR